MSITILIAIIFLILLLLTSLFAVKQILTTLWITRSFNINKYPEFYNLFEELYKKSGIEKKINIKVSYGWDSNRRLNGQALKNTLTLPFSVIKQFYNTPNGVFVAKHILGHELAHLKYDSDKNIITLMLKNILMLFSHKLKCQSFIIESRADIISHSITGLSKEEIKIAHDTITLSNSKKSKYTNYLLGYPTHDQRIHIESSHNEFNRDAFDDIVTTVIYDFFEAYKVINKERLLNDLKLFYQKLQIKKG